MIIVIPIFLIFLIGAIYFGVSKEYILALLTAMVSVTGWIYTSSKNAEQNSKALLYSEKAQTYKRIFKLYSDILRDSQLPKNKSSAEPSEALTDTMINIKSELMIWASDETIQAWLKMESSAQSNQDPKELLLAWGKLFYQMREDLGHDDTLIDERHLISLFLDDDGKNMFLGGNN